METETITLRCGTIAVLDFGMSAQLLTTEVNGFRVSCRVAQHRFALVGDKKHRHVGGNVHGKLVMLHRLITGARLGDYVDHKNRDVLDNRRVNLRLCTNQQNIRNMRSKGGTSKYKGVSRHPVSGAFIARIMVDGKDVRRRSFIRELDAALQYDEWARELFGELAWLNSDHFPELSRKAS